MRVAILHDYLNQLGGAERVLKVFLDIFPHADLFTLFYDEEGTQGVFRGRVSQTSFLDMRAVYRRHRFFIPLMPLAASALRSSERYDIVLSSTAGYAKGFGVSGDFHVSYCHTPLRYAWESEYRTGLPLPRAALFASHPIAAYLRRWDARAALSVHRFIANSRFIADKIKKYYQREAEVVYPPVENLFFSGRVENKDDGYYLMVGRLLHYKRFDLGIEACKALETPLIIAGSGPMRGEIERMIRGAPFIQYRPTVCDDELRDLYARARALIFPQVEDFGLVAAEAQACGTPVVAYGKGGGSEIVKDGVTGVVFGEQTAEGLIAALKAREEIDFNRGYIRERAKRFSEAVFRDTIRTLLQLYAGSAPQKS